MLELDDKSGGESSYLYRFQIDNGQLTLKDPSPAYKGAKEANLKFRIQVSTQNCVGCGVCITVCPTKALSPADVKSQLGQEPVADYLYKHTTYKKEIWQQQH